MSTQRSGRYVGFWGRSMGGWQEINYIGLVAEGGKGGDPRLKASVVIVGSGIIGLTTAYNMALLGERDVIILEQGRVAYGSSTRNAGHFRVHFWAPENAKFAVEANKRLMDFSSKMEWDAEIRRGGYLWLIYEEEHLKAYEKSNSELWSRLGVPGQILTPDEISERFPYVNVDGVIAGFYGPQDGKINPNAISLAYYKEAERLGVRVLAYTKAEKIVVEGGRVVGVQSDAGFVEAGKVLVAAGGWTNELLRTAGIELPIVPERKEIGVTEPIGYFMDPLIISLKSGIYVGQMVRGEILGSVDYPKVEGVVPLTNTLDWITTWAREVSKVVPTVRRLMLLRSWSGYYTMTPDHSHILGRHPDWPAGLYVATGFSGHGFMMAPLAGELMARNVLYGEVDRLMEPYLPTRFEEKRLIRETMVIG